MTEKSPKEKTPDEQAFITVASAMEVNELAQRYLDMLRVGSGSAEEQLAAMGAFAVNALARDKTALWESMGPVGQAAMSKAIDSIADEQDAKLDKEKASWKKIRDRNKPKPEGPSQGGE